MIRTKECLTCGKEYVRQPRISRKTFEEQRFCSRACFAKSIETHGKRTKEAMKTKIVIDKPIKRSYVSSINDIEQRKLNESVDNKNRLQFHCVHITDKAILAQYEKQYRPSQLELKKFL